MTDSDAATLGGRRRRRFGATLAVLGVGLLGWALIASGFALDITEYGLVMRFGRVVRAVAAPGLHLKTPLETVIRLDKRLLLTQPAPAEFLTQDKKNIVVDSLVTWQIADPERYLESVGGRDAAETRIADVVLGEIGSVMGRYDAATFISSAGAKSQYDRMVAEIRDHAASFVRPAYGITLVDVAIRHLFLPDQNKEHVFERMKAERGKIAKQHRSVGELEAKQIIAKADHEKTNIDAEAYAQVQRLKGEGDAEAARIYAAAFSRDPRFYKFLRTLQVYQQFLDDKTMLFLPADAEAFGLLPHKLKPQPAGPSALGPAPGGIDPESGVSGGPGIALRSSPGTPP